MRPLATGIRLLLLWAGLVAPAVAQVLDPPSLRCASVNVSGDVTLNWVVPPDPNGVFQQYEVYHSAALGGPYALVPPAILVYGTTSFTHFGAGAHLAPQYYYVVAVSSAPPPNSSAPSDTLASLFLDVTQSSPLGSAVLDWTPQHVPHLPTADTLYDIWMEYPVGSWQLIGSVEEPTTHFEHVISICEDSLTFRVSVANGGLCTSFSSRDGDEFRDDTPPSPPVITTVSVDTANGQATIDWGASPEGDTDGYIVVLIDALGNTIIDTVWGQNNTFYQYLLSDAATLPESFTVAAFDTCWTGNPPSPNTSATLDPHTTIHASTSYNECASSVTITWTPYGGWPVANYEVYAQQAGGTWFLLGIFNPTAGTALHENVLPFTTYSYVVKAIGANGTPWSLSNKAIRPTDYPPVPQFNYIRVATVLADDHIQVVDSVDGSAAAKRYILERSANGEPFEPIATRSGAGV
ncbi:MAG TPA: fibronectin type III domain-containing protein, partial [Flavobacteriales bacterium]|nr:fibronectin type III domain-containing protein [Flavobacteriales bacterium]